MKAPRRVRSDGTIYQSVMTGFSHYSFILIERPRIASTCANRPPLWEWRQTESVELEAN